jgi:hypothetical protein
MMVFALALLSSSPAEPKALGWRFHAARLKG